ncbi:hypothetical protein VIOR103205_03895 [Vibrio ordalii]
MKARGPFCIRHAAADTFAMVVFCFISGMLIEILVVTPTWRCCVKMVAFSPSN